MKSDTSLKFSDAPLLPSAIAFLRLSPPDLGIITTGIVIFEAVSFSEQTILYRSENVREGEERVRIQHLR